MPDSADQAAESALNKWMESANRFFGLELTAERPNFQVVTQGLVKISIFPIPLHDEVIFSSELKTVASPGAAFLKRILFRNMFQQSTNDGWFAFDESEDTLLWQYRWMGLGQASFDDFCDCLKIIMIRSDQLVKEVDIDLDLAGAQEVSQSTSSEFMIRV